MAIYHFSAQIISRSQGRSSVASAAYRSAASLLDERTGLTHDFRNKSDVLKSEILLPPGASAALLDRATLWNLVEATEKRIDAQLAREINIALPRELSSAQNWELARSFIQTQFVDRGMIADVNFHGGHLGQEEQPHVHVMLTLREITPDGFGHKVRAWNDKSLLRASREKWAEACNLALAKHGFDVAIDHRSLEAQGINLEPQAKIGPKTSRASRTQRARFEEHQALAQRNGERLLEDPSIALAALTTQQSTFTHQDIARFVNRHSVDASQFQLVFAKIKGHEDLVYLGQDDHQRDRYTTKAMLALETKMMQEAQDRAQVSQHAVKLKSLKLAMRGKSLSVEQKTALLHLTTGKDLACVVGYAGTGKSYLLGAAREAWEAEGYRVQGLTLSGIAAENLESGSGIQSRTIASKLWHWERNREPLSDQDILVIDEAGMLGSRQMARIIGEAHKARAKVVLVGDPEQLQAIEAGAAFRAIAERSGFVEMTKIRRQIISWQKDATKNFAQAKTVAGLEAYAQHDLVHVLPNQDLAIERMIAQWDEVRSQTPDKSQLMLAYTREEVQRLNEGARELRQAQGELGESRTFETARGKRAFAEQDRIYFLRNENYHLGVKNGSLGTIEKIVGDRFTVRLDQANSGAQSLVEFTLKEYNDIDHGYAATVYKAQGVTVDRSYILASKYFDRHSTYVAMSRHRESAELYYSEETFPEFENLSRTLSKDRSKDMTVDYTEHRGFDRKETLESIALPEIEIPKRKLTTPQEIANEYIALVRSLHKSHEMQDKKEIHRLNEILNEKAISIIQQDRVFAAICQTNLKLGKVIESRWMRTREKEQEFDLEL